MKHLGKIQLPDERGLLLVIESFGEPLYSVIVLFGAQFPRGPDLLPQPTHLPLGGGQFCQPLLVFVLCEQAKFGLGCAELIHRQFRRGVENGPTVMRRKSRRLSLVSSYLTLR